VTGPTIVLAAIAAVGLAAAIVLLVRSARLGRAVDDAIDRIGAAPARRFHRASALGTAIDRLEATTARAQRERARLAGALQSAGIGILATDDAGTVTFANEAATRFMGARHGEAIAEAKIREVIEQAVLGRLSKTRELELYTPRRRVLQLTAVPLEHGVESLGVVAYVADVTEERRVEAMRRDFIANVGHELKTPLGALAVLAETLADHAGDPEIAGRLATRLGNEAQRLSKLLEDILDLSQAEALGGAGFQPVSVDDLLDDVAGPAAERADAFGVELHIDTAPPEALVAGDRRQLRSMLLNLVDNAVKYSDAATIESAPRVWVRCRVDGEEVVLEVEDEGIGIPEGHLDRIFERFYRVDRGRSRATGGTGLGLSIVRNVALNHGGRVAVESQVARGSIFRVFLPLWRQS
jgi:PAS domain S-box-containing protein